MPKEEIINFISSCQNKESGGISAAFPHDPHILYTLSAVQVLTMYDRLDAIDVDGVVEFIKTLQQEDGSFFGDRWGERDTRFTFCAVMCLSLLHRLDAINVDKAVQFVLSCMNFDGGFGSKPGSESHAVGDEDLETVESYVYLGHVLSFSKEHQLKEISRRVQLGWAAFGKLDDMMRSRQIPQCLKTRLFNQCVLP